jgi:hypothetical protein
MSNHQQYTVQLLEEGRQVAAAVRKAIVSKQRQQHRQKLPANDGLANQGSLAGDDMLVRE